MNAVLILAAGKARRWAHKPKHLMPLWDGETVISRIVRQVRMHGIEPTVVTGHPGLQVALRDPALNVEIHDPGETASVFETALVTKRLWQGEPALLLGDVVFTDEVLGDVLAGGTGLRIFTNPRETYAISFGAEVFDQLEAALSLQAEIARAGGKGSLRDMRSAVTPSEWVVVDDLTDDVDTPEKYQWIIATWGKLDEVGH